MRDGRMIPGERCCEVLAKTAGKDEVGRVVHSDWRCSRHGRVRGSELLPVAVVG